MADKPVIVEATVGKWRACAKSQGSGAPRTIDDARIEATIVKTLESLQGREPLELARHGEGERAVHLKCAHLPSLWLAASSDGDVQALD